MEPPSRACLFAAGDPAADRTGLLTPMSLLHSDQSPVHSSDSPSLLPRSAGSDTMPTSGGCYDVVREEGGTFAGWCYLSP